MDARGLRELGLLEVARWYGLDEEGTSHQVVVPALAALLTECGAWLIVADASAGDDDPFEGGAGKLLEGMLAAVGCRRGGEVATLERQLESATPKVILVLGEATATQLLQLEGGFAGIRGTVHRYREVAAVVTHHPAHLLRSPRDKARAWEDLLLARRTVAAA
jgi:uracil-DNA glycosylase